MFPGNKLGAILFIILILLFALVVGLFMFHLGTMNAELKAENEKQSAVIEQLILQNRGPRGDDGLSAYEIWLSLGNEGSEWEFIESLRGERGSDGIDGRDGDTGKSGSNGASVGSAKCVGTGIQWYLTNGAYVGTTPLVCVQ